MANGEDVAIFWDYENCPAPSNGSGYVIAKNISTLAQQFGTVKSFKAYLEISEQVPRALVMRSELQSSGVSLIDCPHNGRKDVADKMILVDMLTHAIDTPPPSTIVLITGDRDFAYALSILRLRRYHVVLLTLTNAHPSLTMQASVCYDWMSEVVDVGDSPKGQSTIKAGQNVNSPRKESPQEMMSVSPSLTTRRAPLEELEGYTNEEPIDISSYIAGQTHPKRPSQSSPVSGFNPRQTPLERLGEDTASAVSSKFLQMAPTTVRNPAAILPFPSTLCTLMQNGSRGPSAAQSPATVVTVVNPSSPWTTLQDISDPEESNAKRIRSPVPKEALFVLSDMDIVPIEDELPVGTGIISPSPRPSSAPLSLRSPPPAAAFQSQAPPPIAPPPLAPTPVAPPPARPPSTQDPPPMPVNAAIVPSLPSQATSHPTPSTDPPGPIISAAPPNVSKNVLPVPPTFAILVDTLQNLKAKGNLRPLRSTIGAQISMGGATYKNAGVGKFSQYVALAQERGIVDLGGMDGAAWISLRPGWGKANLS